MNENSRSQQRRPPSSSLSDMDVDISVSELINQINGVTSIWLQATSYADRLMAELPSIEYCRCLATRRRREILDRGEKMSSSSETDDNMMIANTNDNNNNNNNEDELMMMITCRCGRNSELNAYASKQTIKLAGECSICLEKYTTTSTMTTSAMTNMTSTLNGSSVTTTSSRHGSLLTLFPCGHMFHRKCIYEWFTNSVNYKCPVCRTSLYKFKKSI